MGQEASSPIDESVPPRTLESRTIDGVAKYIKAGKAKRIVVMSGAGISTSAGIPDFRSPDTGLYANLARLNLPYAEAVFDISFFQRDPVPFYTLAKDLYPGRYRPTLAHSFIRLLSDKQLLLKAFTQNIDCLEREAGVPGDAIVEAHGSFATSSCTRCKAPFPSDRMRELVAAGTVARCGADGAACGGLVKPDIVFFGEALPDAFFRNRALPQAADLAIVMGTSLTVQPFASLPSFVPDGVPRVLINKERVGDLGCRADDVLVLGEADEGVRKLADACGWGEELRRLWEATASKEEREGKGEASRDLEDKVLEKEKSRDELLEEEVEKLTRDVDETLKLGETTRDWARGGLDKEEKE
ncbi:NAD-dependent histone deacetylase SIR2, partial [Lineolata rhizophorae]